MILYQNMKPIEHVLVHPICVLSHLMRAGPLLPALMQSYLDIIEHIKVADEFINKKKI